MLTSESRRVFGSFPFSLSCRPDLSLLRSFTGDVDVPPVLAGATSSSFSSSEEMIFRLAFDRAAAADFFRLLELPPPELREERDRDEGPRRPIGSSESLVS